MRLLRILPVTSLSILVGLTFMSCMAITTPVPEPGGVDDVKAQTFNTLDALQEAGQQGADPAELRSLAATLRQQLTTLCTPFSVTENQGDIPTTTLSAQTAPAPIAPQPALPNQEITATRSAEEYEEGLDETHRAPDPAELQTRRASSAAAFPHDGSPPTRWPCCATNSATPSRPSFVRPACSASWTKASGKPMRPSPNAMRA